MPIECEVLLIGAFELSILEAILTYAELRLLAILLSVGGEVPDVDCIFTHHEIFCVRDHGESFMFILQGSSSGVNLILGLHCHHQSCQTHTQTHTHKHTHTHTHTHTHDANAKSLAAVMQSYT